jgi:hypothetical protein
MAKRKAKRRFSRLRSSRRFRKHSKARLPILPLVSLAPPALNFVNWVKDPLQAGNFQGAAYNGAYSLLKDFAGYDLNEGKWTGGNMLSTYAALLAGYFGHRIASKFGVNRMMHKIPLVGRYLEL